MLRLRVACRVFSPCRIFSRDVCSAVGCPPLHGKDWSQEIFKRAPLPTTAFSTAYFYSTTSRRLASAHLLAAPIRTFSRASRAPLHRSSAITHSLRRRDVHTDTETKCRNLARMAKAVPTTTIPEQSGGAKLDGKGEYDYDLAVIGGGSGGLACAKMAAAHGARTVVFDYVKPSPRGSRWGLGGTCVNVGCVPKYLFHHAGLLSAAIHWDAPHVGWEGEFKEKVTWEKCVETVQNHVKSLNFSYRTGLRKAGVDYINALAKFVGPNELAYTYRGENKICKARYVLVAVGGRPHVDDSVPGATDLAITSDDIFSLKYPPNKTLCVGASYISLECAGFLKELGYDVTIAVRSIVLRGFDRQCAELVSQSLEENGVRLLRGFVPEKLEKLQNGRIRVSFCKYTVPPTQQQQQQGEQQQQDKQQERQGVYEEEFDTVLYATGRRPDTSGLDLKAAGVKTSKSGKIICDNDGCSSSPSVFAVGDVVEGFVELTPVAIQAGEILARRLFAGSQEHMDFTNIPTTVFTPMEYAHTGLSEEAAEAKYGKEALEIYLFQFSPLFIAAVHREKAPSTRTSEEDTALSPPCLAKLICLKQEDERVIGIHFVGPSAGELMQGFALAVRLGAKKRDFDACVGIHPTNAEAFMSMTITKRSGQSFIETGGCGGGKCG